MKSLQLVAFFAACVAGVDMHYYKASKDVDAGFGTFLEKLYASAEDPSTTTAFTDYFTENGRLAVLTKLASSPDQMIGLKQALLPASGIKHWNHFPNATTVYDDSPARRTYHVAGSIASTFDGGNCSIAYYLTRFTVLKTDQGEPRLEPASGSLEFYDDYVLHPTYSPTEIACSEFELFSSYAEMGMAAKMPKVDSYAPAREL